MIGRLLSGYKSRENQVRSDTQAYRGGRVLHEYQARPSSLPEEELGAIIYNLFNQEKVTKLKNLQRRWEPNIVNTSPFSLRRI